MIATGRPATRAKPVTTPSAGRSRRAAVGEQRVFAERVGVHQLRDAFASEQLALLRVLFVVLRCAASERATLRAFELSFIHPAQYTRSREAWLRRWAQDSAISRLTRVSSRESPGVE